MRLTKKQRVEANVIAARHVSHFIDKMQNTLVERAGPGNIREDQTTIKRGTLFKLLEAARHDWRSF